MRTSCTATFSFSFTSFFFFWWIWINTKRDSNPEGPLGLLPCAEVDFKCYFYFFRFLPFVDDLDDDNHDGRDKGESDDETDSWFFFVFREGVLLLNHWFFWGEQDIGLETVDLS